MSDSYREIIFFISEIVFYIIICLFVVIIVPSFLIYPGLYYGRWKSQGPIFTFKTPGGTNLEGIVYKASTNFEEKGLLNNPTVILYFHGNNLNIGYRSRLFMEMRKTLGATIISIDYRGFGNSQGFPSENGIIEDAQTIWDMINNDQDYINHKKIVMGKSLGGAVAISLADKNKNLDGLIVENTFINVINAASTKYSWVKNIPNFIRNLLLLGNTWESGKKIETIENLPKLFISGLKDKIISPKQMKELYDISQNPKKLQEIPEAGHSNCHKFPQYYTSIADFINKI